MSRISMFVVTQIFTWVALGQAGIVQILEPNDSYRAATTKIEISALEFNSQHEFITDGTLRVTFSFPMLKRGPVPTGWTTQAQLVYFGVKGGVPLTDVVGGTSAATSEASRYTGDPMFELRLPASFAFEADALYKRTGYNASQIVLASLRRARYARTPGNFRCW
jgi:hypothetical protein